MSAARFSINPEAQRAWRAGIAELQRVMGTNDPGGVQTLVKKSAGRFVRNVVDVTPPASGSADSAAKKRGELAIIGDLSKIAVPTVVSGGARVRRQVLASAADLAKVYAAARDRGTGRVNPRGRRNLLKVSPADFNRVAKLAMARVGWLAAGLNAAAAALGVKMPGWIKRHGSRYGTISIDATETGIRIRIVQNVPFADNVSGYSSRWNFALKKEVNALVNQAAAIVRKRAQQAGFRIR